MNRKYKKNSENDCLWEEFNGQIRKIDSKEIEKILHKKQKVKSN